MINSPIRLKDLTKNLIVKTVLVGRVEYTVGDVVQLRQGSRKLADVLIIDSEVKELREIDHEDVEYLHGAYQNIGVLWKALEASYGSGLPGDFDVTVVTLTTNLDFDLGREFLYTAPERDSEEEVLTDEEREELVGDVDWRKFVQEARDEFGPLDDDLIVGDEDE